MTKHICISGHGGMVGSALRRQLEKDSNNTIITVNRENLDLCNQQQVSAI